MSAADGVPATLWVVATPIGNLDDLSPRAAAVLREADLVACEDTRRTRVLLGHAGSDAALIAVHAHNEATLAPRLVRRALAGERIALVSDAGVPAVSDPGARVVAAAHAAGLAVRMVPGPGAVESAVAASGLEGAPFVFVGFVPRKAGERARLLDRIDALGWTAVAFESPRRLPALLAELVGRDPERIVVVCRELSKLHEEVVRGTATELAARYAEAPRGEVTIVLAPPSHPAEAADLGPALELLRDAGVGPGRSAEILAAAGVAPRNAAYRAALAIEESRDAR
jgi:16S rRNA (cytidine1402-2'-O)-methyltransferase